MNKKINEGLIYSLYHTISINKRTSIARGPPVRIVCPLPILANNFNDGILKLQILIMIILLQVKVASGARKLGIGNTIQ